MDLLRTKIATTAAVSRLFIMALSFVSNLLIPNHDAGVFQWTPTPTPSKLTICDTIVSYLLDGLTYWDGQYFLHIANNKYTYENTLAFFPLYPLFLRGTAEFIYWCQVDYGLMNFHSTLKIAAVLINFLFFIGATLALFELSRKVLKDDYLAYKSSLYFCINPASIFFTAAYSESLFALISFYTMVRIERAFKLQMGILLSLSTATRANGIINVGFALYKGLKIIAKEIALRKYFPIELSTTVANVIGDALIPALLSFIVGVAPFLFYQWYSFTHFCRLTKPVLDFSDEVIAYAEINGLKLPSHDPSPWCRDAFPLPYSYIQSHYWNVGFLKYYQLKQIPNFILGLPVLVFIFWQGWRFVTHHSSYSAKLGLSFSSGNEGSNFKVVYGRQILPKECFVYVIHSFILGIFCLLFVHVQVSTRMIFSSCPIVYWYTALLTSDRTMTTTNHVPVLDLSKEDNVLKIESRQNLDSSVKCILTDEIPLLPLVKWIRLYYVSYAVVGTVLFSNFLPWT